jgi:glycosyl transferase, family 25
MEGFTDIKNTFYINLEERKDRKLLVEAELKKIGINVPIRFNAVKLENGALGCSLSHLKCLQLAKEKGWDHVLIIEDDIEFLDPSFFINGMNKFLKQMNNKWDVLLIAGNNMLPYTQVKGDVSCIQVHHCLTTTGYLVLSHYYDTLIENYKNGIQELMKSPENRKEYSIDKYWLRLQVKDRWFLLVPPTVIQREDYSDIEKKRTSFKNYMMNYNKCYKI